MNENDTQNARAAAPPPPTPIVRYNAILDDTVKLEDYAEVLGFRTIPECLEWLRPGERATLVKITIEEVILDAVTIEEVVDAPII